VPAAAATGPPARPLEPDGSPRVFALRPAPVAGAVFLSAAGDLLALIVLALQVHELTGIGLAASALFATTLLPVVALAPLTGLVADRFECLRLVVDASLAQAVVAAALAFTSDLAAILALSSLLTAGNALASSARWRASTGTAQSSSMAGARRPMPWSLRRDIAVGWSRWSGISACSTIAACRTVPTARRAIRGIQACISRGSASPSVARSGWQASARRIATAVAADR
jgi:hypothetical protein